MSRGDEISEDVGDTHETPNQCHVERADGLGLRIQGKASAKQARAAAEPKGPVVCAGERLPRITRLPVLAVRLEGLLHEGTIGSGAELARLGGVTGRSIHRPPTKEPRHGNFRCWRSTGSDWGK
jgi:hypothetical protein